MLGIKMSTQGNVARKRLTQSACPAADDWPKRCAEWMRSLGFLDAN